MGNKVFIGRKTKTPINTAGVAVGVTPVQLSPFTRPLEGGVQIVADALNTGIVYVGVRPNITAGSADATDGFPLSAGESLFLPANSESDVWMIADTAAQQIHFLSF